MDLEQLLLLQLLAERFSWIALEACDLFFSLINPFRDGSLFFSPRIICGCSLLGTKRIVWAQGSDS